VLAQWLLPDRQEVHQGQPVCVVETSKASIEIEAPAAGRLHRLCEEGAELELGARIALVLEGDERPPADPPAAAPAPAAAAPARATRKALELAERHGVDLAAVRKDGFITAQDVEALIAAAPAAEAPAADPVLAGVSTDGVTLPASFGGDPVLGILDAGFLEALRSDPGPIGSLPSEEKCELYRRHGAEIGAGVVLAEGTLIVAPRIVIGERAELGAGADVRCEEVFALGPLSRFRPGLTLVCRRAFLGAGILGDGRIRIGGGGARDPWATLAIGDGAYLGGEAFVNVCRPVLIGREVFLTMRSMIITHNIGHSLLEGFENRFAPVVVEDRAQIGLGTIVYAGCRIGREAIVASNSYVLSDIPPGKLAIGVPARVAGPARRPLSRARQLALASRLLDELAELLALRGHAVTPLAAGLQGLELEGEEGRSRVVFVERLPADGPLPTGEGETVILTFAAGGRTPPDRCTILDLLGHSIAGSGGVLTESVRELCRKRGIRFEPGPWRYRGGLV
jgi:acetyltransferase-like isoleucine patch superfamily enzyme